MSLSQQAVVILEQYVGPTVADTCVRATALSVGKTFDTLDSADLDALERSIRRILAPVASAATVGAIVDELRRAA